MIGVLFERDIVHAIGTHGDQALSSTIDTVRTKGITTCTSSDDPVDVMKMMTSRGFRHVPVVDDGKFVDLLSTRDVSVETKSLINRLGLKFVPTASEGLMRADDVKLGERVVVAGYPYGDLLSNTIKVTGGMVSANKGMGDDSGQFQIDAAVQPGTGGGPIYDENGNIVGVVVVQLNKRKLEKMIGSMPENVNFGITASAVRQFLTASGLPTKWSQRSLSMHTKELCQDCQEHTVIGVCRR
jgi:hypothetical protein